MWGCHTKEPSVSVNPLGRAAGPTARERRLEALARAQAAEIARLREMLAERDTLGRVLAQRPRPARQHLGLAT